MVSEEKAKFKHWWQEGKEPDYRFSLANERTYLAWIRTSLAFIASAVGIDQLFVSIQDSHITKFTIVILLSICALILAVVSYYRWVKNEKAMRLEKPLTLNPITPLLSILATLICCLIIKGFIFDNTI